MSKKIHISKPDVIEITFEEVPEKTFTIGRVSQGFLDKITEKEGAVAQCAVLLGCKESEIKNVDLRSLQSFLNQFMEELHGGNPPEADGEN